MTLIHSIILGVVEGLTEFLPISSTGHIILMSHFLKIEQSVTRDSFEIIVQFGAIFAVIITYYKKLLSINYIKKLTIAFIPTGIVGIAVYPYIKYLLDSPILVATTLLIGGIIILITESWYKKIENKNNEKRLNEISYKEAIILGLFQSLAIIPGVSRSGAMIVGGLLQKIPRPELIEFTFLLAVPTMLVASLYTIIKKHEELSINSFSLIAVGTFTSFIIALFIIRVALKYVKKHSFSIFGWYRIIIGSILFILLLK